MLNAGQNYTGGTFTKWIGFGSFKVVAVNPDQLEYEQLTGRKPEQWKGYLSDLPDGTRSLRVTFFLKDVMTGSECPVQQLTYWMRRQTRKNKDKTKTQVIDAYGNTAWVTDAQFKKQEIPVYSNGSPAAIIPPYRPCCDGEDRVVEFLRALWRAKSTFTWDKNAGRMTKVAGDLKDYVFQLDKIKDYWDGDFSELRQAVTNEEIRDNDINAMLFLRKSEFNGNEVFRQDCYWKVTPGYSTCDRIQKEFEREQQLGLHTSDRYAFQPMFKFTPQLPPVTAGAPVSTEDTAIAQWMQSVETNAEMRAKSALSAGDDELPF